jgi:class 3 adenylate cyclase
MVAAMIPGKKIRACFGFCDIRNFTDATECLQEDVMVFVNKIAELVHNKVVSYNGYPNKNIGDAFLVVWKKTLSDAANKVSKLFHQASHIKSMLVKVHRCANI